MTITIDQFMWGFQHTFRRMVQFEMRRVLSHIRLQVNNRVEVLLIGFATQGGLQNHICIEPEIGPIVLNDLISVDERTQEILRADPDSRMVNTNSRVHEARKRSLFLRSRAKALAEAIEMSGKFEGLSFFVSCSAPIKGYDVHTCVGIPSDAFESVPSFNNLRKDEHYGRYIEVSFVQTVVNTCLENADRSLYLPHPGEGPGVLGNITDIVRSSAERLLNGISYSLTPWSTDLFGIANAFSSMPYERSGAKGQLVVTQHENLTNKLKVEFQDPVGLNETRSVRKLLELSGDSTYLLADSISIYGLGESNSAPDVAKITIEGHAQWSISIDDITLLRVNYGHAALPRQILDKDYFKDVAERTVGAVEVERIWRIVQAALEDDHGTTIVVSKDPTTELARLSQQALPIKPEYLEPRDIARLGRVDGATFLGPDGRCYAFGVILDGLATSSGDRARGARFNSSVRYQQTFKETGTIVIVISDDGTVDLIPNLLPRISRQEVEEAVQAFCEYSGLKDARGEEWVRRNERIESLQFYLNKEQCGRVNESYDMEMELRLKSGGTSFPRKHLRPNPEMNDSYFFES